MDIRSATWAMAAGGSRQEAVARRQRQTTPAATRVMAVEGDYPDNTRGPGLLASRSRPDQQPALEPEGVLPALPHAARPGRASAPALVDLVPAQSPRRPLSWSVSLGRGGGDRRSNLCSAKRRSNSNRPGWPGHG